MLSKRIKLKIVLISLVVVFSGGHVLAADEEYNVGDVVVALHDWGDDNIKNDFLHSGVPCTIKSIHGQEASIFCFAQVNTETCEARFFEKHPLDRMYSHGPILDQMYQVGRGTLLAGSPPYILDGFLRGYLDAVKEWHSFARDTGGCWHRTRGPGGNPLELGEFPNFGPPRHSPVVMETYTKDSQGNEVKVAKVTSLDYFYYDRDLPIKDYAPPALSIPLKNFDIIDVVYKSVSNEYDAAKDIFYRKDAVLENKHEIKKGRYIHDYLTGKFAQVTKVLWAGCPYKWQGNESECTSEDNPRNAVLFSNDTKASTDYTKLSNAEFSKKIPIQIGMVVDKSKAVVRDATLGDYEWIVAFADSNIFVYNSPIYLKYAELSSVRDSTLAVTSQGRAYFAFICDEDYIDNKYMDSRVKSLCRSRFPGGPLPRDIFAFEL